MGASCRSTRASRHFCTFKFLSLDLPRLGHPRPTAEATEEGSYGGGLRRCHEVGPLRQARGQLRSQLGQRVESWAAGRQSIEEEACQFHREIFLARKHRPRSTTVAKCRSSPCNALIYPNTISTPPRRFGRAAGRCLGTGPRQHRPGHWPQSRRSGVPHTPPKICVVGSSNMDLISRVPHLPRLGETIVGHSFHMGYGGKGANQAVMAAKIRAHVTLVTQLGRGLFC